ncbi:30S ribosomal protein THX [Luteimonas dalianensis]|uniref:30S ribosomal protein THX n=1 Tax=Luteimonas dalianensis TaxID=1148196 RepID=UPI003BF0AE4C
MGKGDRKTLKGKRYNSSYGNSRPHRIGTAAAAQAPAAGKVVRPGKKVVAKKTVVKE